MSEDVRPRSFDEYVGQRDTVTVLRRIVVAGRANGRACPHVLLTGLPGCGKTSLAQILASEMGVRLKAAVCSAIAHKGELTGLLTDLGQRDVLFLDELHALDKSLQECLYTAAEDGVVDMSTGRRTMRLRLRPFTLVAATTRAHLLTGPLRDRFAYTFHLGHYSVEDLATIARGTFARLGLRTDGLVADEVGRRSRGTPRVANRLVRSCRDFMESAGLLEIDFNVAMVTFDALGIDSLGLDAQDRRYLEVLCERVGAPVGVNTVAAQLGIERGVIEGVVEPYLTEIGLVRRTPQGRVAMPAAVEHLHRNPPRVAPERDAEVELS